MLQRPWQDVYVYKTSWLGHQVSRGCLVLETSHFSCGEREQESFPVTRVRVFVSNASRLLDSQRVPLESVCYGSPVILDL